MGTLLARNVLLRAQRILNDQTAVLWGFDELVDWLNEGQRSIVNLRPDASSSIADVILVAGVRQSLPVGSIRLLEVYGNKNGRACTLIERHQINLYDPSWRSHAASATVKHYLYNDMLPLQFEVYPPQPASGFGTLEVLRSTLPTPCTLADVNGESVDSVISLADQFDAALVDYVVYRGYTKDAAYTVRGGKADMAWEKFMQRLGFQLTTDKNNSPNKNKPPHAIDLQPSQGAIP